MKVPSLSDFEINKIAAAIDKHESFDRPQSLRVTAPETLKRGDSSECLQGGVFDSKLTLHTMQQGGLKSSSQKRAVGGSKKVVQHYPRPGMRTLLDAV